HPLLLTLSGKVQIPNGPAFSLVDAKFRFTQPGLPEFTVGGFVISGEGGFEPIPGLGLKVTSAGIRFLQDLPLPQKLAPSNLELTLSAEAALPVGPNPFV